MHIIVLTAIYQVYLDLPIVSSLRRNNCGLLVRYFAGRMPYLPPDASGSAMELRRVWC